MGDLQLTLHGRIVHQSTVLDLLGDLHLDAGGPISVLTRSAASRERIEGLSGKVDHVLDQYWNRLEVSERAKGKVGAIAHHIELTLYAGQRKAQGGREADRGGLHRRARRRG